MIAKVIRKMKETLRLDGLKEDECLHLLSTHAFDDAENPNDHKKLMSIAGELVKKLYGSPLAAKVMGGVLNSCLDEIHWRNVLNSSLGLSGIFPILKLSYMFLPEYLQSCFSFCSIFVQDRLFHKDELIQMWIAVDFIQPSHIQGEPLTLEDIGERYFNLLIKKSLFEEVFDESGNIEGYKMHDLLHELAQSISKQECFRFVDDEKSHFLEIPKTIRHLSIKTRNPEVFKQMGRFKNLRTLLITCGSFVDVHNEIFKVTRSIRLLQINDDSKLELIPENIGYLHHLRYLSFEGSNVKLLPRSISNLYHLQFIRHEKSRPFYDYSNDYFPRDMSNLSNLRYLCCPLTNILGIGKLKFLQRLNQFYIKNENGYKIEELEFMNDLRFLGLATLGNVRGAEEARNAKLCDKRKLTDLSLNWHSIECGIKDHDFYERMFDNLQPHNYLKRLSIRCYKGVRSAIWMKDAHTINNLESIYLCECYEWEILPPFGQLPFLKSLHFQYMTNVKRLENKFHGNDMCSVFPSLEKLKFMNLEALVDWFDASVVAALFPCLTELHLSKCPNSQELPYLPPKLQSLEIYNIGWKTLNCCSISKSIPLQTLVVHNCRNITLISLAGEIGKLKKLTITDCPNLISLGTENCLLKLDELNISDLSMDPSTSYTSIRRLIIEEEHHEDDAIENCHLKLDELTISDLSLLQMEPLRSCTSIRRLTIQDKKELVIYI